jgi:hypothetical protein
MSMALTETEIRALAPGTKVQITVEGLLPGVNAVVTGGDEQDYPQLRVTDAGLLEEVILTRPGFEITAILACPQRV